MNLPRSIDGENRRLGPPRVALVCIGVGRVQRGFERYFTDLFAVLQGEAHITLFKSGGPARAQEVVPRGLAHMTALLRALPQRGLLGRVVRRLIGPAEYHRDCLAFALCLWPLLRRRHFDVVHCIDPPLASALARLRRLGLMRVPLLFTEGSLMPPQRYPRADHIHHVSHAAFVQALALGVPASHMSLIPCGVHASRFLVDAPRATLRARHDVDNDCYVVLVISALMRGHKRVHHLIEEVAQVQGHVLLWLDGHPEEMAIEELAHRRMGARLRITHVAPAAVPDLYRMADVLVHGALEESFGLAVVEALCSGLPVLVHDSAHFRWLTGEVSGSAESAVDMMQQGALAQRLQQRVDMAASARPVADAVGVRARFDWAAVRGAYLALYRQLARPQQPATLAPHPHSEGESA